MLIPSRFRLSVLVLLTALLCVLANPVPLPNEPRDAVLSPRFNDLGTATTENDFCGQVSWVQMSSGDGLMEGDDPDGVPYISEFIWRYLNLKSDRLSIFYTALPDRSEISLIDQLIKYLGKGSADSDIFPLGSSYRENYRFSRALALGANGGVAYIAMSRENGRTIFSPPSKLPKAYDPDHGNQATVGEIWHYAELPALMRNTKIQSIYSFYYSQDRKHLEFHEEWNLEKDAARYPRNYLRDIALDVSPVIIPGRDPIPRLRSRWLFDMGIMLMLTMSSPADVILISDIRNQAPFDSLCNGWVLIKVRTFLTGTAIPICEKVDFALRNAATRNLGKILEFFLQGVYVNDVGDQETDAPLICAARMGHQEVVQTLLANGANVNHRNGPGSTALAVARENHHVEIVDLLQKAHAMSDTTTDKTILLRLSRN
ncbi:hypothetical protein N7492_000971 [Penicillium capsulatum]|uniref:Ankyrin repeat-containing protein n=1 Tax=Penicillium capsulatum TaxID=69766 RepID=A0A9W9LZH3_9EURO|nr:hypothetical protein N7492_000971 [Penicillium capsulatum]KAJ6129970.1 hypothetical protein N7512_002750 [Penicillium capsulatum]